MAVAFSGGAREERRRERAKEKPPGRFGQFMERVLNEARKDPTYRKVMEDRDGGKSSEGKDRDRDRPRPKPRKR